jgi:hypothetical protein
MAFLQPIWRDTFWRFCHFTQILLTIA